MTVYPSVADGPTVGDPMCANEDQELRKVKRRNSEPVLMKVGSEGVGNRYQYFSSADTAYPSYEYDNAPYSCDDASFRSEMSIDSETTDSGFLEQYTLGKRLGEGAFGVVLSCNLRSTGEEFAVKLVDTVESKPADVWREALMLRRLDHANIVKFHGIFTEKRVLCIVMDKFSGGDLVDGLQRYVGMHGQIPGEKIVGATRQMASAIRYLHRSSVVHRDVKGDNYLLDRPGITDPALHIVLADFGAARSVGRGERMSDAAGTKKFSPPEFFDMDYGAKVDVWALGVVMYGLATGREPFRDENDVRNKRIVIPKTVYPVLGDIINKMLERSEKKRLDSEQLMCHPYLAEGAEATPVEGEETAVSSPSPMAVRTDVVKAQAAKADIPSRLSASKEPGSKRGESKESVSSAGTWESLDRSLSPKRVKEGLKESPGRPMFVPPTRPVSPFGVSLFAGLSLMC